MSLTSQILRIHEAVYKATDGRIGHHTIGVPTLLLRTTGRRSGQPRTNGLVYARDGDDYLVVASNGGAERPPAWLHNLIEPSDPDYERLWKIVNDNNKDRYSAYQRQTSRPIPVIAVTPS